MARRSGARPLHGIVAWSCAAVPRVSRQSPVRATLSGGPSGLTLRAFAAYVGKAEKYSDAITAFWMYQMAAVHAVMPAAGIDDVLRAYPRLLDKNIYAPAPRAASSGRDRAEPANQGG